MCLKKRVVEFAIKDSKRKLLVHTGCGSREPTNIAKQNAMNPTNNALQYSTLRHTKNTADLW
jgi:hypothetical protein